MPGSAQATSMSEQTEERFYIWAEAEGHARPLMLTDLTFARLIDDVVVPYQTDATFFVDGAPLKAKDLKRIKILRAKPSLNHAITLLQMGLTRSGIETRKVYGDQYVVRYEAALRDHTEDVTSQILKAYDRAIKPSIKDYLPKREELIQAAGKIFVEAIKVLST